MINETEKRLNLLFDLINCEALSEGSTEKVLEICQGEICSLSSSTWMMRDWSSSLASQQLSKLAIRLRLSTFTSRCSHLRTT